jgi:hypothetical protein
MHLSSILRPLARKTREKGEVRLPEYGHPQNPFVLSPALGGFSQGPLIQAAYLCGGLK